MVKKQAKGALTLGQGQEIVQYIALTPVERTGLWGSNILGHGSDFLV